MNKNYFHDFIKYSSLNVLGMIGLSCYILADTYFISKGMGADGLAALNIAIPVYSFVHGCGLMTGMGGATKYSVSGGRDGTIITVSAIIATVLAVMFFMIGCCFSGDLAAALGAEGTVYTMAETYIRIILMFSPAFLANDLLICFTRNDGAPKIAMAAMLTGSISNVILDYIFIFPFGMGITGAVLATGMAPIISLLILSIHIIKGRSGFRLAFLRCSLRPFGSVLALGVPSFVTEVSSGMVIIVFNMLLLNRSGSIGVAAYGIIANISLVIISVYTGIAQGMQPVVSRAYGMSDKRGAALVLRYSLTAAVAISIIAYALIFVFAQNIAATFNSSGDELLQTMAVPGLKIYFTGIIFAGVNIVLAMYFAAVECALPAQILSVLRGLVLISAAACILSYVIGINGIWLSFLTAEALSSAIGAIMYVILKHNKAA